MIDFELITPCFEHAKLICLWRNDPISCKNSFTYTSPRTIEEFFPEFIRNYFSYPSLPPLFARVNSERVGVLRFDPSSSGGAHSTEISILVDPKKRGKGLGFEILKAIDPFLIRQAIETVVARIKPENTASIQIFKKAGYKPVLEHFEKKLQDRAKKVYIVAEIGSNAPLLKNALQLIDLAKEAGVDAVKFQMFRADTIYVQNPGKIDYLKDQDVFALFKKLEMEEQRAIELAEYAKKVGIDFLASVFSFEDFERINPLVKQHKIASYEISYLPLIKLIARSGKPLILSTGASTIQDIDCAVDAFKKEGGQDLTLLQCTAKYPAHPSTINLNIIPWLKARYQVAAGLSDHSLDPLVAPLGAVALGATFIEKHFTLSRKNDGPDHCFSIEPDELKEMVHAIRNLEMMMGSSFKEIQSDEQELYHFARRGIQALRDIKRGEILKLNENIAILRPGVRSLGVHPRWIDQVDGKALKRAVLQGDGIQLEDIQ